MAFCCFLVWYYPVGLYRNAEWTDSVHIRAFHTLLIIVVTFLFASSLAHMLIAGAPNEEIAGAFATLLGIMLYAFSGILAGPDTLPRFWIFMYRVGHLALFLLIFTDNRPGKSFLVPRLQLHGHNTRQSARLLRRIRVPKVLRAAEPILRRVHARLHLGSWWLSARPAGYQRVPILPNGQYGPVSEAH
jgi:hypothetical protein